MTKKLKMLKITGEILIEISKDIKVNEFDKVALRVLASNFKKFNRADLSLMIEYVTMLQTMFCVSNSIDYCKELFSRKNYI